MQIIAKDFPSAKCHYYSSRSIYILLVSSSLCIIFLLISIFLVGFSNVTDGTSSSLKNVQTQKNLGQFVFGIASSKESWPKRKKYVKLWWKPQEMQGCVFVDNLPAPNSDSDSDILNDTASLPPVCISEDTSRFRYTYRNGLRSAIRVARVVYETVKLNYPDVKWYVFGDDDTVFFPENLLKTLSKYDDRLWYYIGSNSEIYEQGRIFGFEMGFGGAGFAISYPLAKVLAKVFDSCIQRYPHLYGSDSRIFSCLSELGVGLTHEPGFHQVDVRGNLFGILTSHPLSPLVSLHHMDKIDPIFPNKTIIESLSHLFKAVNVDSQRILQKTVCYDRWFFWTISVAWGYAVEVYGRHTFLPDTLPVQATFQQWKKGSLLSGTYTFNTRDPHPDPCQRPTIFFLDHFSSSKDLIVSHYKKSYLNCSFDMASPRKLEEIKVFSHKLDLSKKQLLAPRRQCCDVLPSSGRKVMEIAIRECEEEELIYMHA